MTVQVQLGRQSSMNQDGPKWNQQVDEEQLFPLNGRGRERMSELHLVAARVVPAEENQYPLQLCGPRRRSDVTAAKTIYVARFYSATAVIRQGFQPEKVMQTRYQDRNCVIIHQLYARGPFICFNIFTIHEMSKGLINGGERWGCRCCFCC